MTTSGTVTLFTTPYSVNAVAFGPDGNIWFTLGYDLVGRMTTSGTGITVFQSSVIGSHLYTIIAGPDGNLWGGGYGS